MIVLYKCKCIAACTEREHVRESEVVGRQRAHSRASGRERETSNDVDNVATRKINGTPLRKVAIAPKPVGNDAVHKEMPEEKENEHGMELHAVGEGAGSDESTVD